jgi:hypothetical protein
MIYLHIAILSIQWQLVDAVDAPTACDQGEVSKCVTHHSIRQQVSSAWNHRPCSNVCSLTLQYIVVSDCGVVPFKLAGQPACSPGACW